MLDFVVTDPIAKARATIAEIGQHSDAELIEACRVLMQHDPAAYAQLGGLIAFLGTARA